MNFSGTTISQLAIHFVGNKNSNALHLSGKPQNLEEELATKLLQYFLSSFDNATEKYVFTHAESLQYNEVYNYTGEIFAAKEDFITCSHG